VSSRAAIAIDYAKFFNRSHHAAFSKKTGSTLGCFKNIWLFRRSPCRLLRLPKRIGLKSYFRLVGTAGKIIVDYVIRRLNALSAGLKNRLKGLTFAETPLARSPDSTGAPSQPK